MSGGKSFPNLHCSSQEHFKCNISKEHQIWNGIELNFLEYLALFISNITHFAELLLFSDNFCPENNVKK